MHFKLCKCREKLLSFWLGAICVWKAEVSAHQSGQKDHLLCSCCKAELVSLTCPAVCSESCGAGMVYTETCLEGRACIMMTWQTPSHKPSNRVLSEPYFLSLTQNNVTALRAMHTRLLSFHLCHAAGSQSQPICNWRRWRGKADIAVTLCFPDG